MVPLPSRFGRRSSAAADPATPLVFVDGPIGIRERCGQPGPPDALTGAQITQVLEQQFDNPGAGQQKFLQVSAGFGYAWSTSAATGSKVSNMTLNGTAIDPSATYRVTVNSFLSGGGDGFTVLASGTDKLIGEVDLQALVDYFGAHSPVAPGPVNRYSVVP